MAINLESLIIFALVLNMLGFMVYALSIYQKKEKGVRHTTPKKSKEPKEPKTPTVDMPKPSSIPTDGIQETPAEVEELKVPKAPTGEETEVERLARELKEMHEEEQKASVRDAETVGLSIEEIRALDKEDEVEQLAQELREIQEGNYPVETDKEETFPAPSKIEQEYGIVFEAEIKEEVKEAKELTEEPEPFELLQGMDEEPVVQQTEEVRYSIDETQETKEQEKPSTPKTYTEPKREMIDAVDILTVEGVEEDEEEDAHDEIVVRHYEPLAYESDTKEESYEAEEDEDAAIKRRIAYLTGEWTDDYIIQPKNKK